MASWTQKKQLFAIVGGAGLVCALAIGGVFYAQGLIAEIETSIESKRTSIAAAEAKIAQIPAVEKDVVILRENLGSYVKILPDTKELSDFVRMLNQFQRQSGFVGTGLVPKPSSGAKGNERFARIEYTYEMTATLWEFLKFVNLVENYERFVNITEFTIQSGDKGKQDELRDGSVVHTMKLTLQTYTYNGRQTGKEVQIPDYDGQVEALREEILKRVQKTQLEKYQHRGRQNRRDILVDPRLRGDIDTGGPSPAEQRAILERYVTEAKSLRDMQQRMRHKDATMFEQYALEKRVREGLTRLLAGMDADAGRLTYEPYRVRWGKEVVEPIEELRSAMEQGDGDAGKGVDPYLPAKELEQLVAQLEIDCKSGQLEDAKTRYESVAARLNVPNDDARHALAIAAKALHTKASTALDFANLDVKMQGVVVNRAGRSGVLLNGEVYEEGEYVSDELLVKLVEEEQVTFVFRGLTLVRTR